MECLIKKIRDDVMAKGNGLNSLFLQRKKIVLLYIYSEFNKKSNVNEIDIFYSANVYQSRSDGYYLSL